MGQYPDERYMRLREVANTEATKQIKVTKEEAPELTEYLKKLRELQNEAKRKGIAR